MNLDLLRNIRGALVFLNIFDLTLEENENVDENTYLKVLNKEKKEVGKVYFQDKKIKIISNTQFGLLNASYDLIDFSYLSQCSLDKYFKIFNNKIEFSIDIPKLKTINGIMNLDVELNYMNEDFNIKGDIFLNGNFETENIFLKLRTDGSFHLIKVFNNNTHEMIEINPFATLYDYFCHDKTTRGENNAFFNTNFAIKREWGEKQVLKTLAKERKNGVLVSYLENIHEIDDINSRESLIIKGVLMRTIDQEVFLEIKKLRDLFKVDNISLLDKLISFAFQNFTNLEVRSLLGLEKVAIAYQNDYNNLKEAYLGENNEFLLKEKQKKLFKE